LTIFPCRHLSGTFNMEMLPFFISMVLISSLKNFSILLPPFLPDIGFLIVIFFITDFQKFNHENMKKYNVKGFHSKFLCGTYIYKHMDIDRKIQTNMIPGYQSVCYHM